MDDGETAPGRRGLGSGTGPATPVELDGSAGEGGGQILRTALSLSLLTGRPFRISRIRANRDRPGLRPQHLAAVGAAARLGDATVEGAGVGSSTLTFRPGPFAPGDLAIDIGTAGSTSLVLHTLYLPIALRADRAVRLSLTGGTFNPKAPSFPFLDRTWRHYLSAIGLDLALAMPSAGFYPQGGGLLEAWIEPTRGLPRGLVAVQRGRLVRISGVAGACKLDRGRVADRMRSRAATRLDEAGLDAGIPVEIDLADWPGPAPGAAIALTAEFDGEAAPASFVGLGERGKPAEVVAEEAVAELLAFLDAPGSGAVDPHSADQLLLPLALAEGRSVFTVGAVTEHLRTNARTIAAFLDRPIAVQEPEDGPGRVIVG
ncbi:RNA 3'-terminal phosphate cyclase [Tautonia plasticadhaerens]|uniref:RNA 3'-terminal phosphate cyclase n=1 Tax=Tautonia plasticadhaerens TaxID=2527974 RepID=A0A518GUI4_9BACT|nr:RNA 3'-terminal phosphate cyclase [Tautonia plasticadhaerens]QDV32241.1 RNA 3'-terminal phosphate cyclase [Tautonia plasticadhaerens]